MFIDYFICIFSFFNHSLNPIIYSESIFNFSNSGSTCARLSPQNDNSKTAIRRFCHFVEVGVSQSKLAYVGIERKSGLQEYAYKNCFPDFYKRILVAFSRGRETIFLLSPKDDRKKICLVTESRPLRHFRRDRMC